jgi:exodeoxyribonuclease VII small subunit
MLGFGVVDATPNLLVIQLMQIVEGVHGGHAVHGTGPDLSGVGKVQNLAVVLGRERRPFREPAAVRVAGGGELGPGRRHGHRERVIGAGPGAVAPAARSTRWRCSDRRPGAGYVDAVPAKKPDSQPPAADGAADGSSTLSYEQARDQLAEVVRQLEAGGLTLEQSLDLWERGERLAAICEQWLEGARARLEAVAAARPPDAAGG